MTNPTKPQTPEETMTKRDELARLLHKQQDDARDDLWPWEDVDQQEYYERADAILNLLMKAEAIQEAEQAATEQCMADVCKILEREIHNGDEYSSHGKGALSKCEELLDEFRARLEKGE